MPEYIKDWRWFDYDSVGSTNDIAKEYALKDSCPKAIITAITQTNGRGRRGRKWVSQQGNLFMSHLFVPSVKITEIAFVASLSVAQTIKFLATDAAVKIKWPNDVLINGKKVCGMLIETSQNAVIVGIGVNLVSSPDISETIYEPTDLKSEGILTTREEFLEKYTAIFEENIKACAVNGFAAVREQWLKFAYRLSQPIAVRQGKNLQEGLFIGIDEQGFLLLKQQNKITKISVGDVIE